MRDLKIPGLVALSSSELVKTNGGASNAKAALTNVLAQLKANGASANAIAAITKNIKKH